MSLETENGHPPVGEGTASTRQFNYGRVRQIDFSDVLSWLQKGWEDFMKSRQIGLMYGAIFAGIGYTLTALVFYFDVVFLALPMAMGFALIGPFLAVGLYETSRRMEAGEDIGRRIALLAWRAPRRTAFMGLVMVIIMIFWVRSAFLLFMLFYGVNYQFVGPAELLQATLFTMNGWMFLGLGSLVGGFFAFLTFSLSVVSITMIIDREVDPMTAMITSLMVVRENFQPMLLWAIILGTLITVSLAPAYLGLFIIFPWLAHSTWHAYRGTIEKEDA